MTKLKPKRKAAARSTARKSAKRAARKRPTASSKPASGPDTKHARVIAMLKKPSGATIAAIMVGNLAVNGVGFWVAHIDSIARGMWGSSVQWTPAVSVLLFSEFLLVILLIVFTFFLQSRKKDFL